MFGRSKNFWKKFVQNDGAVVIPYRLTTLMLAGGYFGVAAMSLIYVKGPDRYGFTISEYQRWCMVGLIGGVFAGFGAELGIRVMQRPGSRFSIREFMLAIALVAMAIVACGAIGRWAMTSDYGAGNTATESSNFLHHR